MPSACVPLWPRLRAQTLAFKAARTARIARRAQPATCIARLAAFLYPDFAGRPDPMAGTPEDVGRELKVVQEFIKRLEARETGLAALAETMIRQGKRVPYFSFEQTAGRLAWTAEPAVLEMIAQLSGKTIMAPVKPITPTQARDRKILDARVISEYSARPNGAFKLVPDSTKTLRSFKT